MKEMRSLGLSANGHLWMKWTGSLPREGLGSGRGIALLRYSHSSFAWQLTGRARLTLAIGTRGHRQAISPLLDRSAPGVVHLLLSSSIQITPLASLSRPVAGTIGSTLVVTLPGSPKAAGENISALLSSGVITHALDLLKGGSGKAVHKALGVPDR